MLTSDPASPQHCLTVDPDKEWSKGWTGFIHRKRGLALSAITKLGGVVGIHFWLNNIAVTVPVFSVCVVAWGLLLFHRQQILKSHDDKRTLHDFCHWLRDEAAKRPKNPSAIATWVETFSEKACQHIASHFRATFSDSTVTASIRLARDVKGKELFVTTGRSDGLDPNRASKSSPLERGKGIARILMDKGSQGIWIIPDIPKAIELGMWEKTSNDVLEDIRYVMAAPINAMESGSRAMLGILSIGSRSRQFAPLDTIEVKAWVDLLGLAYSETRTILTPTDTSGS